MLNECLTRPTQEPSPAALLQSRADNAGTNVRIGVDSGNSSRFGPVSCPQNVTTSHIIACDQAPFRQDLFRILFGLAMWK